MYEMFKCLILGLLVTLLAIMSLVMHRYCVIREWEIEAEKERRNQPEFSDEYT